MSANSRRKRARAGRRWRYWLLISLPVQILIGLIIGMLSLAVEYKSGWFQNGEPPRPADAELDPALVEARRKAALAELNRRQQVADAQTQAALAEYQQRQIAQAKRQAELDELYHQQQIADAKCKAELADIKHQQDIADAKHKAELDALQHQQQIADAKRKAEAEAFKHAQQMAEAKRQADYFQQQAELQKPPASQPGSNAKAPKSSVAVQKPPSRVANGAVDYRNPHDLNNPFAAYQASVMTKLVHKARAGTLTAGEDRDLQVFVDNGWTQPVSTAKR